MSQGFPHTTLKLGDSLEAFPGLKKAFPFMVMVYYCSGIQITISKRKRHMREVGKKPGRSLQVSLPARSHGHTPCNEVWQHLLCCPSGKRTWTLVSRISIASQSHRHESPAWLISTTEPLASQSGEVVAINHSISINCLIKLVPSGPRAQSSSQEMANRPVLNEGRPFSGMRKVWATRAFWINKSSAQV